MLVAAVGLAVVVGLALGLLGGGGSILTVPLLVYVAGMDTKQAIATSLFVVGVTSLAGLVAHARAGTVRWRTGLVFGLAGMAGAFTGGLLGGHLPGQLLLAGFALMMLATAVAMLRGRRGAPPHPEAAPRRELPLARVLIDGAVVGLITGLVGAGGGFLVVPALALLGGLPMPVAVGTSLVVIAMKSFAGFAGYLTSVPIDWLPTLGITSAAVLGALAGGKLAGRLAPDALRRGFGWFVLAMGAVLLVQQLPGETRWIGLGALALAVLVAGGCTAIWTGCPLRRAPRTKPTHAGGREPNHGGSRDRRGSPRHPDDGQAPRRPRGRGRPEPKAPRRRVRGHRRTADPRSRTDIRFEVEGTS